MIVLVGWRAVTALPVQQYPQLESSSVLITTVYTGASAETVRGFLTIPIERAVSSFGARMNTSPLSAACATVIVGGILFSLLMARSITRPVAAMQQALTEAARAHDLTQRVSVSGENEIGRMALAFNTLMQALQDTLKKVVDGAHEVSSAAAEMAAASGQITQTAGTQAEAAASTAAAVEQVTVSINQVAESTRETRAVSDQASTLSANGETTARNTAAQMARTADSVAQSMPRAPVNRGAALPWSPMKCASSPNGHRVLPARFPA